MFKALICWIYDHEVDWDAARRYVEHFEAMKELTPEGCTSKWPVLYNCKRCNLPVVARFIYVDGPEPKALETPPEIAHIPISAYFD